MRKAIFSKFIQLLLLALILNSLIFYIVTGSVLLKNSRKDMLYTLETIDSILDYSTNLEVQADKMAMITQSNYNRFTIIGLDGIVAAETELSDPTVMDNHLEREEIQDALLYGSGYSRRYSRTLQENMLYVAYKSQHADYILRLAAPFAGMSEFLIMLLPAIFLSFAVVLIGSAFSAEKFSDSITKPLHEISKEMLKVNGDYTDLHFERCQYPEINIIADTTTEMSHNVKEYLNQLELEKQIRQEFFSNASHELKTPITSIQGYAELLENDMIKDDGVKQVFLKRIKKEAVNMTNLINDILMISRLESKEAQVVMSEVRVAPVIDEIVTTLRPFAAASKVTIHVDCMPITIIGNIQQLTELFNNLISNAIKYNHPDGQIWVTVTGNEHVMTVKVKDNGVGIPEESLPRIFERFYRVDKGRSKKQGGTGLGLAIVKHIVNYYHGTIEVNSKPDEGTEFVVTMPVKREV